MKKETRNYLLILTGLNTFLITICAFLLFDLLGNKMIEFDRLNLELITLRDMNTRAIGIERMIKGNENEREKLDLYFITKETTTNFIEELESVAGRSGVIFRLNSLNISKEKAPLKDSFLKLSFRAEGSFVSVFHFLRVLEAMPYRLRFNSVNITKVEGEPDSNISLWSGDMAIDLVSYIDK